MKAYDNDTHGNDITYSLDNSKGTSNLFDIDATSGNLTLKQDYNDVIQYKMWAVN